ncbi:hypothetical protein [Desulfosarcina variabilis]|uniref:hypothetical protein n=1 Tax=Desulfosarcina variabilis TaxID=2300 RepID=UPI003AFAFF8A
MNLFLVESNATAVYCPGLATGIGQVPAETAAQEMASAYRKFLASTRNWSQ